MLASVVGLLFLSSQWARTAEAPRRSGTEPLRAYPTALPILRSFKRLIEIQTTV
jgi:hypothetical protein